jgi:putative chitinase
MGNGDPSSGDGWKFRGRGLLQATGREMYDYVGHEFNLPLLMHPELLLVPSNAALSAATIWKRMGLSDLADGLDFVAVSSRINLGYVQRDTMKINGFADRLQRFTAIKNAMGIVPQT